MDQPSPPKRRERACRAACAIPPRPASARRAGPGRTRLDVFRGAGPLLPQHERSTACLLLHTRPLQNVAMTRWPVVAVALRQLARPHKLPDLVTSGVQVIGSVAEVAREEWHGLPHP